MQKRKTIQPERQCKLYGPEKIEKLASILDLDEELQDAQLKAFFFVFN